MAFNDGWNGVFSLDNSSGTPVDLTSYIVSLDWKEETAVNEVTAWGNSGVRSYRPGLMAPGTISITFRRDPAVDAVFTSPRTPAGGRTAIYGPDGSTASNPRRTVECFITSYSTSSPLDGVQEASAELQMSGAITRDTF